MDFNKQLFDACFEREPEKVCASLNAGADANAVMLPSYDTSHIYDDMEGMCPLMLFLKRMNPFTEQDVKDILPAIQCLLDHGADINCIVTQIISKDKSCTFRWTPLTFSYHVGNLILMEFLLSHGANPNLLRYDDGGTFLDAVNYGYVYDETPEAEARTDKIIQLLKKYGAKSGWHREI